MAIKLEDKTNTIPPTPTYPYGDIKNDSGSNDGTPVDQQVYGDFHQFFAVLMASASMAFNGLRDNAVNGFQYIDALAKFVRLLSASETESGTAPIATQALTNAGVSDATIVTPLKLHTYLGAWVSRNDVADVVTTGGSGITKPFSFIDYKIIGKTMIMNYYFQITNTTIPSVIQLTIPDSKQSAHAFSVSSIAVDRTGNNIGYAVIDTGSPTLLSFTISGLVNGTTISLAGSLTFEIA